jgi:hypothetical protein
MRGNHDLNVVNALRLEIGNDRWPGRGPAAVNQHIKTIAVPEQGRVTLPDVDEGYLHRIAGRVQRSGPRGKQRADYNGNGQGVLGESIGHAAASNITPD